jgi:hypothetical protein
MTLEAWIALAVVAPVIGLLVFTRYAVLRVRCGACHAEHLVAFSCKKRGVCPS